MKLSVLIRLLQALIVVFSECVFFGVTFSQDSRTLERLASRTKIYCDGLPIDVPFEMKQVMLTIATSPLTATDQKSQETINIKIVPTAFWEGKEDKIDGASAVAHEMHLAGLLNPLQFKGRVLHGVTQEALNGVRVDIKSDNGVSLAETYTNNEGFFSLCCWIEKEILDIKLHFQTNGYQDNVTQVSAKQRIVGPVLLMPGQQAVSKPDNPCYKLITLCAKDGLENFIKGLKTTLEFTSKAGVKTRIKAHENNGLYSALIDEDAAKETLKCTVSIEDTTGKWENVTKEIDCSTSIFLSVFLEEKGDVFVNGTVKMEDFTKARVWLVPVDSAVPPSEIAVDMVGTDEKGNFRFLFRDGKEKNKCRLGVTWDDRTKSGITPLWVSPKSYSPALYGGTNKYTLGTDIVLEIPKDYLEAMQYASFVQYGNDAQRTNIIPLYDPEITLAATKINELLEKLNKPPAVALNAANSFEVLSPGDKNEKIVIKENLFLKGQYISLKSKSSSTSTVIAIIPVGRPETIKKIKEITKENVNRLLNNPGYQDEKTTFLCGDWLANATNWQQNHIGLDAVKPESVPVPAYFSRSLNNYFYEKLKGHNRGIASRYSMILLIDDSFLGMCGDDSFDLTKEGNLQDIFGDVSVVIFSESYLDGVNDKYKPIITHLKDAFKNAYSFKCRIVNPIGTAGLDSIITEFIPSGGKGNYEWVPVPKQKFLPIEKVVSPTPDTGNTTVSLTDKGTAEDKGIKKITGSNNGQKDREKKEPEIDHPTQIE